MRPSGVRLVAALAAALAVGRVTPAARAALPPLAFPAPLERTLDNGLRVGVLRDPRLRVAQVLLLVPAGTSVEPVDQAGIAQVTAELLGSGTTSRAGHTYAVDLDRLGGNIQFGATRDYAYVSTAFLAADLASGLELMSDAVVYPVFEEDAIRRVVDQRISALNPNWISAASAAEQGLWATVFGAHPYGHAPGGTPATLRALTRDRVVSFHRAHVIPTGSVLVIAGGVEPEPAFAAATEWFGRWSGTSGEAPPPGALAAPAPSNRVRIIDRPGSFAELRFGVAIPGRRDPDALALEIANLGLAGDRRSRVGRLVRETFGIDARRADIALVHAGLFSVGVTVRSDSVGIAARALRSELERLSSQPPDAAELAGIARALANATAIELETAGAQARQWATSAFAGLPSRAYTRSVEGLDSVSVAGLAAAIRRALAPERFSIVAVGPAQDLERQLAGLGVVEVEHPDAAAKPAPVATVTPAQRARGREQVRLAVAAHGGRLRLARVKDSTVEAAMTLTGGERAIECRMRQIRLEPLRMIFSTQIGEIETHQVLSGERGWSWNESDRAPQAMDSLGIMGIRAGYASDIVHLLLEASGPAAIVVSRGRKSIDARSLDAVEVTVPGSPRRMLYFDPVSHRLRAMDQNETGPQGGFSARRIYRDYRLVNGVWWPFSEDRFLDGQRLMHLAYTRVAIDAGVDPSLFEKPEEPLTAPSR